MSIETKQKQIIPVGKRILVRQDQAEKKYGEGVIDKPDVAQDPPSRGEVLEMSQHLLGIIDTPFSKMSRVLYGKWSGVDISDEFNDGRVYKILEEEDILAVVQ